MRLLRALSCWVLKPPRMETVQLLWSTCSTAQLFSERKLVHTSPVSNYAYCPTLFWYYGSQNCVQYPVCDLMGAEHFIRILCYFQSYVKEALGAEDAAFSPFRVLINLQLLFLGENLLLIPLNTSCPQAAAANCFFLGKYPLSKIWLLDFLP